jgi:hypothetical protein
MFSRTAKEMDRRRRSVSVSAQVVNLNSIEEHPLGIDSETERGNRSVMQKCVGTCSFGCCGRDF